MNWDRVEGDWKQFKGKVQQQWGKLTDDDLDVIEGNQDRARRPPCRSAMATPRTRPKSRSTTWMKSHQLTGTAQPKRSRAVQPTARLLFLCALRSKNSAWLITAETIAGW